MLLFVRNPYYAAIKAGVKRFELRAGPRYRNVKPGDWLSINGRERVCVTRVDSLTVAEAVEAGYTSANATDRCYPDALEYFVFHFDPPVISCAHESRDVARRAN